MKYQNQKRSLEYQKEISEHYFRNVSNNSGILDTLVGSAEDQEFKEAALAYFFLLMAGAPLTQKDLDGRIEDWFRAKHQLDLDFKVEDAVAKLERLELLQRSGQGSACHLSNKPSASSTASGTTSSLMLVSRRNPQHGKRRLSQQEETSSTSNAADLAYTLTQQLGLSSPAIPWRWLPRTAAQPLLPDAI